MSEQQPENKAKSGIPAATPTQSDVLEKIEKDDSHLTEDELRKISGGLQKPIHDQY
jgi:hypothetical protein